MGSRTVRIDQNGDTALLDNYEAVSDYILSIPKFTKKNLPEDSELFYSFLGRPGEQQKIIHVAGTNGKGSVCAYSEAMILATGHTCGLFTSPHLNKMTERIRCNHEDISENAFVDCFQVVMKKCEAFRERYHKEGYHPTFFELIFFIAMIYFDKHAPEYIILETGLGGRLDTTNVVKNKMACVITKIALDHTEYLGETLDKIAMEKAGIITGKTYVFFMEPDYPEEKGVGEIIRQKAREYDCPCYGVSKDCIQKMKNHEKYIDFSLGFEYYGKCDIRVPSCAVYQGRNAALAIVAMKTLLQDELNVALIQESIEKTVWPCRMEEVQNGIILDGAHNPDGVKALLDGLAMRPEQKILLFSVVKDKDASNMIQMITGSGIFEEYIITVIGGKRASDASYVMEEFQKEAKGKSVLIVDPEEAFAYGKTIRGERLLVVAGSLYLTGLIRGLCKEDK